MARLEEGGVPPFAAVLADGEPKALLGKLGWLFLCNAGTMNQLVGGLRLKARQLPEYRRAFEVRWARFESLGIPYVLAPIPMKEQICSELLPDRLEPASTLPLDQLGELFDDDPAVEIADLRPALRRGQHRGDVYPRTDTHLSALGGHCVYAALLESGPGAGLGLEPHPLDDFPLAVNGRFRGDLADKRKVRIGEEWTVDPHDDPAAHSEATVVFDGDALAPRLELQPADGRVQRIAGMRKPVVFQLSDGPIRRRAVVVGDSFMWRVVPFLLSHFQRVVCLWMPNPPFSIVEAERPDVVFQLNAERHLIRSPLMPDWELSSDQPVAFEPEGGVAAHRSTT